MLLGSDLAAALSTSRGATPTELAHNSPSLCQRRLIVAKQRSPLLAQRSPASILRPNECRHFHYETVELGPVVVDLVAIDGDDDSGKLSFSVESNGRKWVIFRSPAELIEFDRQLHRCVFDRRHSKLEEFSAETVPPSREKMRSYARRLSLLTGSLMRCYPVLTFLELDNRGNHFRPVEHSQINIPAVACAVAVCPYTAESSAQLELHIGDIVSVVDTGMGAGEEKGGEHWMHGKLTVPSSSGSSNVERPEGNNNKIGLFPASCVRLFSDRLSLGEQLWLASNAVLHPSSPKSDHNNNHSGRLFPSLRSPLVRSLLRRSNNNSCRCAFGADLAELAAATGRELPAVVEECVRVVERVGLEPGIYRQCGIQSNVHRLRRSFDAGQVPQWDSPAVASLLRNDVHSVGSLLKQFFRQLPNPLVPFECYGPMIAAFGEEHPSETERTQLDRVRSVVQQFPSAHFRTAQRLFGHLQLVAQHERTETNAHNLAIVWTPNLIRCPPLESEGPHQMAGLDLHTDICAFLISFASAIFGEAKEPLAVVSKGSAKKRHSLLLNGMISIGSGTTKSAEGTAEEEAAMADRRVHSVLDRPSTKHHSGLPLSLANSFTSILVRPKERGEKQRGESADRQLARGRSQTQRQVFSPLSAKFGGVGSGVLRRVRSMRDSVRRFRKSIKTKSGGRAVEHTNNANTKPNNVHSEQNNASSSNGNACPFHLRIPFADDAHSHSPRLSVSPTTSHSDPSTVKGPAEEEEENEGQQVGRDLHRRRVVFDANGSVTALEMECGEATDEEEEGEEGEEEEVQMLDMGERECGVESVDSMPLDISRYDNVSNSVTVNIVAGDKNGGRPCPPPHRSAPSKAEEGKIGKEIFYF